MTAAYDAEYQPMLPLLTVVTCSRYADRSQCPSESCPVYDEETPDG